MQGAFLLDVVARQYPATLELLDCRTQTLLVRRGVLHVMDVSFHVADGQRRT